MDGVGKAYSGFKNAYMKLNQLKTAAYLTVIRILLQGTIGLKTAGD